MTRFERALLWISTFLVSLSGVMYGYYKYLVKTDDPFAAVNHPAQPFFLKLHVLSAPVLIFAVGLVYAAHVWAKWTSRLPRGRRSGIAVWAMLLPMIATGYLLETVTDRTALRVFLVVHLASGGVFLTGFVTHQVVAWRARRRNGAAKKGVVGIRRVVSLAALLVSVPAVRAGETPVERRWVVMGTYASVELYGADEATAERTIDRIRDAFDRVDRTMSNWKESSELSVLNREAGRGTYRVRDLDLFRCVTLALDFSRITEGAFDPTVGPLMRLYGFRPHAPRIPAAAEVAETMRHVGWRKVHLDPTARSVRFADPALEVDLGGIAKGYALDLAVALLAHSGSKAALLDLGGELYAWGRPSGESAFRIGIRDPSDRARILGTLPLENRAVSTSGNYENSFRDEGREVGHLMDPSSGRPAESDVVAATVVAERGADADALSTGLLVSGSRRAAEILARSPRAEVLLVVRGEEGISFLVSQSLEGLLEVDPRVSGEIGGRVRYVLPPLASRAERSPS